MAQADLYNMSDVFISYSRRDSDFVHRLFDDIKATGKEVWADFEDIPKAADWWQEIQAGIDAADAFVFIISPDSVRSEICRQEIDHALESNKRLLPVLHREVIEEADKALVHPAISSHNWIFFRSQDDYDKAFQTLLESLETDLDHNRTLTRLLVRAKDWQDANQPKSLLLQGDDLANAEGWLTHAINKNPAPTSLHAEYIQASRAVAIQRQRQQYTAAIGGMVLAIILATFSIWQMYQAQQARDAAEVAREQAEESELEARAIALAASSAQALANNNPDLSLVLAQEAISLDTELETITTSLADAAYAPGTVQKLEVGDILTTAVYAPDSSFFVGGYMSGEICLYDGSAYTEMQCLVSVNNRAHSGEILWIHLSFDGTRLLSSGGDDRLLIWDVDSTSSTYGTVIHNVMIPNLSASVLSQDGTRAVFGTNDGMVGVWNVMTDTMQTMDYVHTVTINVLALNGDDTRTLAGTANGILLEFDLNDPLYSERLVNPSNRSSISSVAYSPDGTTAIAGDDSATLTAWDLDTRAIFRTFQGHNENVTAITFADDGRTMFTASWDNSIREWDIASGRMVQAFYGHNGGINALSIDAENRYFVSGGFDRTIRVWLVHPVIFEAQYLTSERSEAVYTSDWNDTHIVAGNNVGEVYIYNRNTGEVLHELEERESSVISLAIRPNGNNFAVVLENCVVELYSMRGERLWQSNLEDDNGCRQIDFRPDHDELLVMSEVDIYRVDGRAGEVLGTVTYKHNNTNLRSFEFTADGNRLLVGNNSGRDNLQLIDFATGEIIRTYEGHTDGVLGIDISADGTRIASGSFDNDVRIWDFETGELLQLLEGHSDRVVDVDFNPSGNALISASNDTTMRLWDLETGILRYTYQLHTDRVVTSQFSPDGTRILTASYDSTLIIWRFPQHLDELAQWVSNNRYIRELTCGERNIYLYETNDCE